MFMAIAAGVGLAISALGLMKSYDASEEMSESNQRQIALQQQNEEQRKKAMELDARARQLKAFRLGQQARSLALVNATSQGAGGGSGLQGGYGQIAGDVQTDLLGINQNLEIGRDMFDTNALISEQKIAYAQSQGKAAMGAALTSFGGSIMTSLPAIGRMTSGFAPRPNYTPTSTFNAQPGSYGYMH